MHASKSSFLGKYREIVLAVAFFLVFDLAVLVLNFYTSYQISTDAVAINLSGRQRMLSQRMTKALLQLEADRHNQADTSEALKELRLSSELFSSTLEAFSKGGTVKGGDNQSVELAPVATTQGHTILRNAQEIWRPYAGALEPLLAGQPTDAQIETAALYARSANLKLLKLMNELTTELESVATAKADRLRMVQTGGIALALLNFAFILFKFIRKLRESDRMTEAAQKETSEILGTVKDGIFLLDKGGHIGLLHSRSLDAILHQPVEAGQNFIGMLQAMVDDDSFQTARDYIELLFGDRVRENLIASLNPLQQVQIARRGSDGNREEHYLSFHFNRVVENGQVLHLLVTVADITEKVVLAAQLENAKVERQQEMEILLNILKIHPDTLRRFLEETETTLEEINANLRNAAENEGSLRLCLNRAFRAMHTIKGNAAMMGLENFEKQAHEFENTLSELRRQDAPSGEAVLSLAFRLEEFFQSLGMVKKIFDQLSEHYRHGVTASPDEAAELSRQISALAGRIADDQHKMVKVDARLDAFSALPAIAKTNISEIAIQLTRNAVVHGIESPAERAACNKQGTGTIQLRVEALPGNESFDYELVMRDDGRGLAPERIRKALVASGRYTEEQLAELNDKQVIMQLFEPGFSTLEEAGPDAGRGFGLDVVYASIKSLGGHLSINSRPQGFTEFRIRFAI